jgi:hypothetical protein
VTRRDEPSRKPEASELRREVVKDCAHDTRKLLKRWNDRLVWGAANLRQRYLDGKLRLHLHVRVSSMEPHDLCAVFYGDADTNSEGYLPANRPFSGSGNLRVKPTSCPSSVTYQRDQQSMLVGVIQFMQEPERVIYASGLERLQILYPGLSCAGDSVYHSFRFGFVLGGLDVIKDREPSLRVRRFVSGQNQRSNQVVERRSEVIESIASDQTEIVRRSPNTPSPVDEIPSAEVWLSDELAWASVRQKEHESLIEITDLLVGPFDLQA